MSKPVDLKELFRLQAELNARYSKDPDANLGKACSGEYTEEQQIRWLQDLILAMQQELAEATDSLPWKWWAKKDFNLNNLRIELIDMFHFWMSACMVAGMDAEAVWDLYCKKNRLNRDRQDQGYKEGVYRKVVNGMEDNERLIQGERSEDE